MADQHAAQSERGMCPICKGLGELLPGPTLCLTCDGHGVVPFPHVLHYKDADGVAREMLDPDFPWEGRRGELHAIATTSAGVVEMLDRMEAARG